MNTGIYLRGWVLVIDGKDATWFAVGMILLIVAVFCLVVDLLRR